MSSNINTTLRSNHNEFKFKLLEKAVNDIRKYDNNKIITCLDLGVGRCNDIHKWEILKINNIIGIDNDEEQLKIANERIKQKSNKSLNIKLYNIDLNNIDDIQFILKNNTYEINLVVAFFSIHYYLNNLNDILNNFIILPDCMFITTYMNVYYGMFYSKCNDIIENDLLYIQKLSNDTISVSFKNTPYFKTKYSIENIVNKYQLLKNINKYFKTYDIHCFLDFYEDLNIIEQSLIETELLHEYIIAKK